MQYRVRIGSRDVTLQIHKGTGSDYRIEIDEDTTVAADLAVVGPNPLYSLLLDGKSYQFFVQEDDSGPILIMNDERYPAHVLRGEAASALAALAGVGPVGPQQITAPMPGMVIALLVGVGDEVEGQTALIVVESMKMNNQLRATGPGTVKAINVQPGQRVERGQVLIVLE